MTRIVENTAGTAGARVADISHHMSSASDGEEHKLYGQRWVAKPKMIKKANQPGFVGSE